MKIKDILKKVALKQELTPEELKTLSEYEDRDDDSDARIPKERLDREIAKRRESENKLAELNATLSELTAKVEELETKGLPEKDKLAKDAAKLQKTIADLTAERDAKNSEIAGIKFTGTVAKLAGEHGFSDTEYLGYMLKAKNVALDDADAVKSFVGELKKNSPKLFKADIASGAGTRTTIGGGGSPPNAKLATVAEKVAYIKEHGSEAFEKQIAAQNQPTE